LNTKTEKLVKIYLKCKKIFDSDKYSWEEKYDRIFEIRAKNEIIFPWTDWDTSYEEDVTAFMEGFKEHISKLENI
jgi:hypothetical protein